MMILSNARININILTRRDTCYDSAGLYNTPDLHVEINFCHCAVVDRESCLRVSVG